MAQNFDNHVHRTPLAAAAFSFLLIAAVAFALRWFLIGGRVTMAIGIASLGAATFVLILTSRRYATKLQDRIIRLEMRVRGAGLLTPEQQRLLAGLSMKHVAALRFASDGELPALLERACRERMEPQDIKRAVKVWVADLDRT